MAAIPFFDDWNSFPICNSACDACTGWIQQQQFPVWWQIFSPSVNNAWPALNEPDTFLLYRNNFQPLYTWRFTQVGFFQFVDIITTRGKDLVPSQPEAIVMELKFTHFGIPLCPQPTETFAFKLFSTPPTLVGQYKFDAFNVNNGIGCDLIVPPVYIFPANCRCGVPESIVAELPDS